MPYDLSSNLWPDRDESFFRNREVRGIQQVGPHCVSTVLAMLADRTPEIFQGRMNTQDPVSWSAVLQDYGLKLAYCPTDVRKIRFYLPELLQLNDLFTLSYYIPTDMTILKNPNARGWICGSHIVIMHKSKIFDPATGKSCDAQNHHCGDRYTKRIFRVVPADYPRGL